MHTPIFALTTNVGKIAAKALCIRNRLECEHDEALLDVIIDDVRRLGDVTNFRDAAPPAPRPTCR